MAINLTVVGAAGRMGKKIIAQALASGDFNITSAIETTGHSDIGNDAGLVAGVKKIDVNITDEFAGKSDVVIDFSLPQAAAKTVDYCLSSSSALVMGTTGLAADQRQMFENAAKKIPLIYGTNMSVGMNVLFAIVGKTAQMLGEGYDIEIIEQHHRFKKDAPSGSAITLAEKICDATGTNINDSLIHGRAGKDALRKKGTIGMHAVRAGDITGIHSVIFSTLGETVTLNHTAHSRDTFVFGALRAAKFLADKNPGSYTMADVLGIE